MRSRLSWFVVAAVAAQLIVAAPVAAARPTTEGLTPDGNVLLVDAPTLQLDVPAGQPDDAPVLATATLSVDPGGGTIAWRVENGPTGTSPVGTGGVTQLDLGYFYAGISRRVWASFSGFDVYPATAEVAFDFTVVRASSTTLTTNRTTAYVGELPVVLTATVTTLAGLTTVTFLDDVAGDVVELGPVVVDGTTSKASFSSNTLRVGAHSIRARFNADQYGEVSLSAPVTVNVYADTAVHATLKASLSTFYPYKDGVKDTVKLGGTLSETATVTIRVYNSAGTRKRTWSLGTKAAGSFSATWNGRTASGTKLAAGKYKVVGSFKDTLGHTKSITINVNLSWREATWKTGSTITKYGDQWAFYADQATDRVFLSPDYSRGRTMDSGEMIRDCTGCGWVAAKKTFQLNTAGIAFKSIYGRTVGHGYDDREHPGEAYYIDPSNGAWIFGNSLPEFLSDNYNVLVPAKYVNSSKQVKLVLYMQQRWGDAWDLHYVKLYYKYAVWK